MYLNAVEKVMYNVNIVLLIFNLLDLEDQFRLSRTTAQFKKVFETFIWRNSYTTLRVLIGPHHFEISNETVTNRRNLNKTQFMEFQKSYAADVKDLTINDAVIPYDSRRIRCDERKLSLQLRRTLLHDNLDLKLFRRVNKLRCHNILLELSYMNFIADCCPNLQELSLIKFDHVFAYEELQLSHNIDISQALALPTKIKHLKLLTNRGTGSCRWLKNFSIYLVGFPQLSSLYINLSSSINDAILAIIAVNCKHLEKLTFECVDFKLLQPFVVPQKLSELTLNWCAGLTCNNLRQMLSQLKLSKFYSKKTKYVGEYSFSVSPYIANLSIDGISTHHFKPALESHANLQELSWFQHETSNDMDEGAALSAWINLETLDIHNCDVVFNSINYLTKLKKVIIPRRPPHHTWPFVLELLKHPYLNELILRYPEIDDVIHGNYYRDDESADEGDRAVVAMNSAVSHAEFKTNLHRLKLSFEIFKHNAEFWINLFRRNDNLREMSLICLIAEGIDYTLQYLICDDKLPQFIKTLNICGITINCQNFRVNFNDDMPKLKREIGDFELRNDDNTYNITLQRSSLLNFNEN